MFNAHGWPCHAIALGDFYSLLSIRGSSAGEGRVFYPFTTRKGREFFLKVFLRVTKIHNKLKGIDVKTDVRGKSRGRVEGFATPSLGSFRTCLSSCVYRFFITQIIEYCCFIRNCRLIVNPPPPPPH